MSCNKISFSRMDCNPLKGSVQSHPVRPSAPTSARMNDIHTNRPRLAPTIAIVVSCVGLLSACGAGARNTYTPPPPPPPVSPIVLSTHVLTFDPTPVGATSPGMRVTLKNTSSGFMQIATLPASNPDSFARTTDCGHRLAGGESCAVEILFNPQTEGKISAQIDVVCTGFQTLTILLYGEGRPRPQGTSRP